MSMNKQYLFDTVEKLKPRIISIGRQLFEHPELGFKEFKTAELIKSILDEYNLTYESELSITGLKCTFGNGKGYNVGILAELDALPTFGHRCGSDDSSAAHSCGHSIQVAIMLGVIMALNEAKFFDTFNGSITFVGAPAEEFTDIDYRKSLLKESKIKYLSGKQDMINNGVFDDIDLMISCHTMGEKAERSADVNSHLNGFIHKEVIYTGKAAHAGANPHQGINALNAALIGLSAVNFQRETFIDEDNIRVHSIIKNGNNTVNTVPDKVEVEAYVRGNEIDSLLEVNKKVNRSFEAGAYAIGAKIEIIDTNGYIPFEQSKELSAVMKKNLALFIEKDNIADGFMSMASGDIGDLATIIPTIQFGFSGVKGAVHGPDFEIVDEEMSYIIPAKAVLGTLFDLFEDTTLIENIISSFKPSMTKEDYFREWLRKED